MAKLQIMAAALRSVSLLCLAVAAPAFAQTAPAADVPPAQSDEDLRNDVVVTASKRDSTLQDIPFSINAQTAADIQKSGAVTLEDLSRNVAGLSIQNLGPGQSQVAIRGVSAGQIVRDQPGVKEQVGIYLDESVISLSLFTPDLDLFDLNRVETLRGPQGTLFGSGSVGGTIRYITNQPKIGRTEGSIEANANVVDGGGVGGEIKGAVNIPLGDTLAARAVGYFTGYPGYIDALRPGGGVDRNVNGGERYGGRLTLLWKPIDILTITPRIVYQRVISDGFNRQEAFNLFANPFTTTRPPVTLGPREQFLLLRERFSDETVIADGTIKLDLGAVDVTSVTSYTHRDILVSRDASALTGSVSVDLGFPTAAVLLPSNLVDTTKVNSVTQEVRLGSTHKGPFQWVAGGFYANIDRFYRQRLPTPGYDAFTDQVLGAGTSAAVANGFGADSPFNSNLPYTLRQFAFFGEGSYTLDRLTLTAGGRYYNFKETRRFTSGGLFSNDDDRTDTTSSDGVTPRFLLSYKASNHLTFNAQASRGFRLGGVNDPLNLSLCTPADRSIFGGFQSYRDEKLWDYEGGFKAQGHGFTLNAAGFYNQISNLQVTLDAGSCSSRVVFNVPKAHSAGFEFEGNVTPLKGLTLGVSGTVVDSKFDSTVVDGTGAVLGGIRKGNRLPSVPEFQISANASYEFPVDTKGTHSILTISFQHIGDRFTQPSDQENNPRSFVSNLPFGGASGTDATVLNLNLPAYQLLNLSAGLEFKDGLSLKAYVNNVTDTNPLLSFDRERGGRARLGFAVGQPRTYGITLRKSF